MYDYLEIQHLHLEISTRCNAACPGCPRNLCGVNILDDYPLHDMTLEEAKTIFPPKFIQQLRMVDINGNLGDFVTARDGVKIVRYFREQNPNLIIRISTTASAGSYWKELAELRTRIYFAIDGLAGTHELYRRQTNWNTVINNAKEFISAGGWAIWKMIKFDHNLDEIDACMELSKELKFRDFELIDHGRNQFPVFDQKTNFLYDIGVPSNRNFEQIKTQHYSYKDKPIEGKEAITCDVKRRKSVYVTATGEVYPCCWTGYYPTQMKHMYNDEIKGLVNENNALEYGIEHAIKWFNLVENSWSNTALNTCKLYCGS